MVPVLSMWTRVLRSRSGEDEGSWMPTLMGSECCLASDWRPRTNGELVAGWHRESDSGGEPPM